MPQGMIYMTMEVYFVLYRVCLSICLQKKKRRCDFGTYNYGYCKKSMWLESTALFFKRCDFPEQRKFTKCAKSQFIPFIPHPHPQKMILVYRLRGSSPIASVIQAQSSTSLFQKVDFVQNSRYRGCNKFPPITSSLAQKIIFPRSIHRRNEYTWCVADFVTTFSFFRNPSF